MNGAPQPSFGIKTTTVATYADILRVWQEADAIPAIEHAWLWDHLLPLFGRADAPILEGWTSLAALAAQTERVRLGLMVTANTIRPPAVLAKIAATVDHISGGRLNLGIGVGATDLPDRPHQEFPIREYGAYGMSMPAPDAGIARLAEACTIIKRMWTEDRFDFDGVHYQLTDVVCEPKPVQRPPFLIGGWGRKTLRVVAEHADIWNVPGPPHNSVGYIADRSRILDEQCAAIGRDPREIVRSTQVIVSYDDAAGARAIIGELLENGVTHIVVNLPAPFPAGAAQWAADEIITPVRGDVPAL